VPPFIIDCAAAQIVITIYDIQRAVADKATVPIYYESRVAKLGLNESELPKTDEEFEAITEGEELTRKENGAAWGCCDLDGAKRSASGFGSRGTTTASSSRRSRPRSKRWSRVRSGSTSSPLISCSTTNAGSKRWKARR